MKIIQASQRSDEWKQARIGMLTGSCANEMMANGKSKGVESVQRRDLRIRLALERLTGQSQEDSFISKEMQRGIDKERDAFAAYEAATGNLVKRTGFLVHDELSAGCSLDGHVGDFIGIIELKCPKSATHLKYLRSGVLPPEHFWQVIHNMWITNANWCDFVSFDDRFPPALQLFRVRVSIDALDIQAYHLAASLFLTECERELEAVQALAGQMVAA